MDPISAGLAIIGLGTSIFGGASSIFDSGKAHKIQEQIAQEQTKANQVRQQAMELSANRQQIENVRNIQRARSLSTARAVNQGAQYGSGLPGAYGQISGEGQWNSLGINQALLQGQQMFGINNRISDLNSQLSSVQSNMATDQGIASIGSSIFGVSGKMGNIFGGFGSNSQPSNFGLPTYGGFVNGLGSNGIY